jgi:penicillin amidase
LPDHLVTHFLITFITKGASMSQKTTFSLHGVKGEVSIQRLKNGYPHLRADHEIDLFYGLGYVHALDRPVQMWLLKLVGMGKASECLLSTPEMIAADKYLRWVDLAGDAMREAESSSPESRLVVDAYCKGVNDCMVKSGLPLEFRMVGYKPDAWTPADVALMSKMIGFVGLASTQADLEKFIIQLLQNGVDPARLRELFPPIREEITPEYLEILKKVKMPMPIIPPHAVWKNLLPSFSASNNWAVAPEKAASGKAILCGDPHLGLQLPNIWYTAVLTTGDHYLMGASVPGIPAVAVGRTPHLAWSATYGTMDLSDFFIEEVKDGKYRRGEAWLPLTVREEVIRPKKGEPVTIRVYSTEHGVLEGEPDEDGFYLSFALSIKKYPGSVAQTLDNFLKIFRAKNAEEALEYFAGLTFAPFNWVMADSTGNIAYQLAGMYPQKREGTSGLLPYLGWDARDDWQGVVDPHRYPRALNPKDGILVTSNQDLNHLGQVPVISLPMSSYRADRIRQRLLGKDKLTVEDMKSIHYDRFSLQAQAFLEIICPLLPDTPNGRILREWDMRYTADSLGATLFERVYSALVNLVFGELGFGEQVMTIAATETPLFAMQHGNFDRVLLSKDSAWFAGRSREEIYKEAITRGLQGQPVPHGETRKIYIENLFFGGKLPRFLGFDHPYQHIGSRATVSQAQLFKSAGRLSSFAPTLRMVCDFATDEMHLNMTGGASGNRFSPYYWAGVDEWEKGIYQVIKP